MKIRAVLIDDERRANVLLQRLLEERTDVEVVGVYTRTSELLEAMPRLLPDAAFVDIEMPGADGLTLAETLQRMREDIEIVFVTAYRQYALDAFRVNAANYLLKPVDRGLLEKAVAVLRKRLQMRRGSAPAEDARVRCFGGLTVLSSGRGGSVRFPTAKAEELFAYLLVHRDALVSKWAVCESLWPGHSPEKASQNLHTTIFRMKKTLQEHGIRTKLESVRGYYRFELLEPCDYLRLAALADGRASAASDAADDIEAALRAYKGTLFEGRDYLWCETERERMEQAFAALAKALAACFEKAGERQRALDLLQRLLLRAPYEEDAHEAVLRIYCQMKDRASFVAHYKKMEGLLRRELGLAPSAALRQLYDRMVMEG